MGAQRSNLRIIVKSKNHDDTVVVISNSPGIIQDIQDAIDTFSQKHSKGISITKEHTQYEMNTKAFAALQNIIYDILK